MSQDLQAKMDLVAAQIERLQAALNDLRALQEELQRANELTRTANYKFFLIMPNIRDLQISTNDLVSPPPVSPPQATYNIDYSPAQTSTHSPACSPAQSSICSPAYSPEYSPAPQVKYIPFS